MGTLVVGLMVVYILDVLKMAEAALISLWCTLVGVYLAMLVATDLFTPARSPLASIALLISNCLCLFLAGLWATLQFRWVQTGFPGVALACERALFAAIPPVCGAICAWTAIASVGAGHAPFYARRRLRVALQDLLVPHAELVSRPAIAASFGGYR